MVQLAIGDTMTQPTSTPTSIEEAIRRDLPGWKLATPSEVRKTPSSAAAGLSVKRVGDLEQLRAKFLRNEEPVQTILVESPDGRHLKVADVRNGKVSIVQG
jgi:hypothetical protein